MTAPLRQVAVKHPRDAFVSQAHLDVYWKQFRFTACPNFLQACRDMDIFINLLASRGAELVFVGADDTVGIDSIYVRDSAIVLGDRLVGARMGKPERRPEPAAMLRALDLPVAGCIEDPGHIEGGDVIWLDDHTLAVAQGYRSNADGVRQLGLLGNSLVQDIIPVPMPHWNGPADVLHLMSVISPVADDLAVVYSRLMPVPFRNLLLERGLRLVEVPDHEYETLACNVLALEPGVCLMAEGNPGTRKALMDSGCEVLEYPGAEISLKGCGGPTCLTQPLNRR